MEAVRTVAQVYGSPIMPLVRKGVERSTIDP